MEKKQLRVMAKSILSSLSEDSRKKKSKEVSGNLCEFLKQNQSEMFNHSNPLKIGSYCPIQKEVLWHLEWSLAKAELAFPRINEDDKSMIFYSASIECLNDNWGITIPNEVSDVALENLDVLIIPGLLFTKCGERLGRGAGYYDRFLQKTNVLKIAVCFEDQIVPTIVTDEHDCLMDFIVTETNIYKRG